MAKVKITGHASGTGVVTVTAPNTSTDRTITLPDATATIATTTDVAARLPSITDGGNATAITIDSAENVGIGNTTPEAWDSAFSVLQLGGAAAIWGHSLRAVYLSQNMYNDGAYKYLQTAGASLILMNDGEFKFRVAASGSADAAITWTDALQLKSDGRGLSQFTAKAWVNLDMLSASINDSHNISGYTDNSDGNITLNFSNSLANNDFAAVSNSSYRTGSGRPSVANAHTYATGSVQFRVQEENDSSHAWYDWNVDVLSVTIFGD